VPRILIVDDEPAISALLRIAFVRAGYHVEIADNVAAAKAVCAAQPFDAVLSDVVMPDGNGHELMRWIALNRPATATVLMTGFDVGCEKCAFSQRCKLLAKPFKPEEAVALLTTVISTAKPSLSEQCNRSAPSRPHGSPSETPPPVRESTPTAHRQIEASGEPSDGRRSA
jgi:DNA-binding NtrC family response regulator